MPYNIFRKKILIFTFLIEHRLQEHEIEQEKQCLYVEPFILNVLRISFFHKNYVQIFFKFSPWNMLPNVVTSSCTNLEILNTTMYYPSFIELPLQEHHRIDVLDYWKLILHVNWPSRISFKCKLCPILELLCFSAYKYNKTERGFVSWVCLFDEMTRSELWEWQRHLDYQWTLECPVQTFFLLLFCAFLQLVI